MKRVHRYLLSLLLLVMAIAYVCINRMHLMTFFNNKFKQNNLIVRQIKIDGISFFDQKSVLNTLAIKPDTNIFSINLNDMIAKLLFTLPWIKEVKIERIYPDTLVIKIVERKPIAYFRKKSKLYLIDESGTLMESDNKIDDGIVFSGDMANVMAYKLLQALKAYNITCVASADYIGRRRWNIETKNGLLIKLPEDGISAALSEIKKLIEEKAILEKNISIIDFRLPDRILIKESKGRVNYNEV